MRREMPFLPTSLETFHKMEIYSFRFTLYCVQLNAIGILLSWCFSFSALFLHLFLLPWSSVNHPYTHTHVPIRWRDEWKSNWKVFLSEKNEEGEKMLKIQSNKSKSGSVISVHFIMFVYVDGEWGGSRFFHSVTFIKIYNPF
jgi:hypothetical protein